MTTDNKTLADVQPGGRVRLGDVPECAKRAMYDEVWNALNAAGFADDLASSIAALAARPSPGGQENAVHCGKCKGRGYVHVDVDVDDSGGSIGNIEACPHCAIAAPPSPGGQGDARALIQRYDAAGAKFRESLMDDHYSDAQRVELRRELTAVQDELLTALAARQPVGQEPAFFVNRWEMEHGTASGLVAMRTGKHLGIRDFFTVPLYAAPTAQCAGEPVAWMTHHDEPMLFPTAAEAAAYCEDDEQPVPLFRSPAPAVDLGDFKALYRAYVRLLESGRDRIRDLGGACDPVDVMEANDVDLQAARRVIDSKAVGK